MTTSARAETYCTMPFVGIYVQEDGTIYPCCFAPGNMPPFGNANTDDVEQVWQQGMEGLRQRMLTGDMPGPCRNCTMSANHLQPLPQPAPPAIASPSGPVDTGRESWVFRVPEREFLRLCAMIDPDWASMRQIARTALDYGVLRRTALLHQLDGVVAWRLLDDRMDGIAPNIVRDDCQRYVDHLAGYNRPRWEEFARFEAAVERAGLPHVVKGGPAQYAPLGISGWPRSWADFDMYGTADSIAPILSIAIEAGAESTQFEQYEWLLRLPGGACIDLEVDLIERDESAFGMVEKSQVCSILGCDIRIPAPEANVALMGYATWSALTISAARLPLWGLARLAAWTTTPNFQRSVLSKMLCQSIEGYRGDPDWPESWRQQGVPQRNADGYYSLQTLLMADRAYGLNIGDLGDLVSPHPVGDPLILTAGPCTLQDRVSEQPLPNRLYTWARELADEELLFDMVEGIDARVAAGIWVEVEGIDRLLFRYDRTADRNTIEIDDSAPRLKGTHKGT